MIRAVVGLSAILLAAVVSFGGQAPTVVSGRATFVQNGSDLTIRTSARVVIHWNSFNVPQGSTTRFVQPGPSAVVINRVYGPSVSRIDGLLAANGRLALINPNGIRIGPTGVVRAQSFIASTLTGTSSEDIFAGGDQHFTGPSTATIENFGRIEALGGDVYLIAHRVANRGTLSAPNGRAGLAAGNDVLLTQDGELFIRASLDETPTGGTGVDNSGVIEAIGVQLAGHGNVYALAVNTTGVIRATGSVRTADGRIVLRGGDGAVRTGGLLAAQTVDDSGATHGGEVQILARRVHVGGSTVIDVSGEAGGGRAYVGGSFKGAGPLPNAEITHVDAGATINADATDSGDGGEVVVWSDHRTDFLGLITARGGAAGGDGGLVEVSGKGVLAFDGWIDTTAPAGRTGTLILDPMDVVLRPGSGDADGDGAGVFHGPGDPPGTVLQGRPGPSVIYQSELEGLSGTTNIRVEAKRHMTMAPFGGGDVNPLTFAPGGGTVAFVADADGDGVGDFTMDPGDRIVTNGRDLAISGHNVTVGRVNTGDGRLTLTAGGDLKTGRLRAGMLCAHAGQADGGSSNSFGPIRANDVSVRGGGGDDTFTFRGITSDNDFMVSGRGGNDTFTLKDLNDIDVAGWFAVRGGGQAGGAGDRLKLLAGSFDSVGYTFTGSDSRGHDGYIELCGAGGDWRLDFAGLEPIFDNLNAVDRVFTLSGADDTAVLADHGNAGSMVLAGAGFETTVFANPSGSLTIKLGAGDDKLVIESLDGAFGGSLSALGQAGDDRISAAAINYDVELSGGRGDDKLWGGRGDDFLCGGPGDDKLWGGRGDDDLAGGRGEDRLWGGRGDDFLSGGRGDDRLWGQRGEDRLVGGRGDDILCGGPGDDKLWGGRGDDILCGGPEPAAEGGPMIRMLPPPIWWDITNRTEEWVTASDDGYVKPIVNHTLRVHAPIRLWARPLADVLDTMNAYFDAMVRARARMNFYAWR